ncbi:TPA: ead/Ea22-like family protein [Klebsiella michiganensis]|nr:ead/Ea22-like family protein [Klebsiella michiganensis]
MTDITELAQSLKAAAEKATQGNWRAFQYHDGRCGISGGHHDEIMVCEHISKERPHDAMFIALANPANVLALVEALEKAQQRIDELENDEVRQRLANAEHQLYMAELAKNNLRASRKAQFRKRKAAEQRIAELESRTVKLPKPHAHLIWIQAGHAPDDYCDDVAVSYSEKDRCCDGSERYPVYARWEIEEMLAAAGIKWEAE